MARDIPYFLLLSVVIILPDYAGAQALFHGSRHEKKLALTFDACPSSLQGSYDAPLVQTLIDSCVPATFFLSGKWMIKHRNEVKKLASIRNFELGNHSYSHPHCTCISDDSVRQELERTEFLLKSLSGTSSKLFRPPYAETNRRIECIAQKIGLTTVMYDLASGDPDSTISRARLVQYVAACARNGSILVMHVNGRGWHTAEALPEIIHILRSRGFTFVKVSELLSRAIGAGTFCSDRKNP